MIFSINIDMFYVHHPLAVRRSFPGLWPSPTLCAGIPHMDNVAPPPQPRPP